MNYQHQLKGMISLECRHPIAQTLDKPISEQLTQLVSKDLLSIFHLDTEQAALAFCGAAYPVEQILQPKEPIHHAIERYASAAFQGQQQQHKVLSIGANNGIMPQGLQPKQSTQELMVLPFCLFSNDVELLQRMEQELMHKGMLPPPTYQCLSEHLQVPIQHANYMTLLDLTAMMHNHYQKQGLEDVWLVIEAALLQKQAKLQAQTAQHNHFILLEHLLFTPMFSYRQYHQFFGAKNSLENHLEWSLIQRVSMAAFAAHGIELHPFKVTEWPLSKDKICLGELEKNRITNNYWLEASGEIRADLPVELCFIESPKIGLIAIEIKNKDAQSSQLYYPLNEQGINDIEHNVKANYQIQNSKIKQVETSKDWPL